MFLERKIRFSIVFLFGLSLLSRTVYPQDDVIRIETDLVAVPVTVFDREGRYITNLKKDDFQIFEDGVEQEIAVFESVEKPFTVFLLFDISGSMSNHLAELAQVASAFVGQLRADDQIIASTFADNVYVLFKLTKVSNLRKEIKIQRRLSDRNTYLYDAVDDTLKQMKKIRGRKAIVLFADGAGTQNFASAKSNLNDAEENESLIYTIQFNTFFPGTAKSFVESAQKYMQDLAKITGGRYYQVEKISNLAETFKMVAEELSRQYSLGYYPKQTENKQKKQTRQIKVKVRQPNLAVRARGSYVFEPKK